MVLDADKVEHLAVAREITERYLRATKGTPEHEIKVRLGKKRGILDELVAEGFIHLMGDRYVPRFGALESLDPELREIARKDTDLVLRMFKRLYSRNGPGDVTADHVMTELLATDPSASRDMVDFGMLMATDFSLLRNAWTGLSNDRVQSIRITENILDVESAASAWEEELRIRHEAKTQERTEQPHRIAPLAPAGRADFSFVKDNKLRGIIDRDYRELQTVKDVSAVKSCLILAGGLIEALLLDALGQNQTKAMAAKSAEKRKPVDEWNLSSLIDTAVECGLISEGARAVGHAVRDFRNLIHPGKEKRSDYLVGQHEANIADEVLQIVIRDLQKRSSQHSP